MTRGRSTPAGVEVIADLVGKRIDPAGLDALFGKDAVRDRLRAIALWSGGYPREIVRLLQIHRAALAVDLAHATLDPAPTDPVGVARELVQRAVGLLGDTAEDFIARVLAVEARGEFARRLADRGDDEATAEAQRALELARPLAGHGVPAWDAILALSQVLGNEQHPSAK